MRIHALLSALVLAASGIASAAPEATRSAPKTTLTWHGHAAFQIETPKGPVG